MLDRYRGLISAGVSIATLASQTPNMAYAQDIPGTPPRDAATNKQPAIITPFNILQTGYEIVPALPDSVVKDTLHLITYETSIAVLVMEDNIGVGLAIPDATLDFYFISNVSGHDYYMIKETGADSSYVNTILGKRTGTIAHVKESSKDSFDASAFLQRLNVAEEHISGLYMQILFGMLLNQAEPDKKE